MRAIEIRHEITPRLPSTWHRLLVIGCGDCLAVVPGLDSLTRHGGVWAYLVTMPGASRALTVASRSGTPPDARLQLALDDSADVALARSDGQAPGEPLRWFDGLVDVHHTNCAAHGLARGHVPLEEQLRVIEHSQAAAWSLLQRHTRPMPVAQRIYNVTTNCWVFGRDD